MKKSQVFRHNKLNMNQQFDGVSHKSQAVLGCIKGPVVSKKLNVIISFLSAFDSILQPNPC